MQVALGNTAGFDVLRPTGNQPEFNKIAFVPSASGSALIKLYELSDDNSYEGTSFYRLKQLDLDSQFEYSKIIAVKNKGLQSLTLCPNPARNVIYLDLVVTTSSTVHISLCDAVGNVLQQQSPFMQQGSSRPQFNISQLTAGAYYIRMQTDAGANLIGSFIKR